MEWTEYCWHCCLDVGTLENWCFPHQKHCCHHQRNHHLQERMSEYDKIITHYTASRGDNCPHEVYSIALSVITLHSLIPEVECFGASDLLMTHLRRLLLIQRKLSEVQMLENVSKRKILVLIRSNISILIPVVLK